MNSRELPPGNSIQIFEPGKPWVQGAARAILASLHESGVFVRLVLAGGSTPAAVYEELSSPVTKGHVDWKKVRIWSAIGAAAVLAGGMLPTEGVWEVVDGEGALSTYDKTGVSVFENGVLCSDGSSVTFPS